SRCTAPSEWEEALSLASERFAAIIKVVFAKAHLAEEIHATHFCHLSHLPANRRQQVCPVLTAAEQRDQGGQAPSLLREPAFHPFFHHGRQLVVAIGG